MNNGTTPEIPGLPWRTQKEVAWEYKLPQSTLSQRLRRYKGPVPRRLGPKGSTIAFQITPELAAWFDRLRGERINHKNLAFARLVANNGCTRI